MAAVGARRLFGESEGVGEAGIRTPKTMAKSEPLNRGPDPIVLQIFLGGFSRNISAPQSSADLLWKCSVCSS